VLLKCKKILTTEHRAVASTPYSIYLFLLILNNYRQYADRTTKIRYQTAQTYTLLTLSIPNYLPFRQGKNLLISHIFILEKIFHKREKGQLRIAYPGICLELIFAVLQEKTCLVGFGDYDC